MSLRPIVNAPKTWPHPIPIEPAPRNGLSAAYAVWPGTIKRLRIEEQFKAVGQISYAELAAARAAIALVLSPDAEQRPRFTRADLARALLTYRRP